MKTFEPGAYSALARRTVAEGCVLLRNEGQALPLPEGAKVAVFGRRLRRPCEHRACAEHHRGP